MKHKKLSILIFIFLIAILSLFYFAIGNKKVSGNTAPITYSSIDQTVESAPTGQTIVAEEAIPDMPILMYHHVRAFDDPSDTIGTNLSVDPQSFAKQLDLILSKGYTAINFNDILTGAIPTKPIILTFDDGYENFYTNAYSELKKRNMKAVSYIIYNDIGKSMYMNETQIKEISQNNIEISSHTLSHPDLTKISNDNAISELSQSKEKLELMLGIKINSLCYPSGKVNSVVESDAKSAGYSYAVTTKNDLTNFSDVLLLNRYRVNHDTNISAYIK